jgi:hypothetical protein
MSDALQKLLRAVPSSRFALHARCKRRIAEISTKVHDGNPNSPMQKFPHKTMETIWTSVKDLEVSLAGYHGAMDGPGDPTDEEAARGAEVLLAILDGCDNIDALLTTAEASP